MSKSNKTKRRVKHTAAEVTAQPSHWPRSIAADPDDTYASIEPEELGGYALREATQSGWPPCEPEAPSIGAIAASDIPLSASSYRVGHDDVWLETLDLAAEFGELTHPDGSSAGVNVFENAAELTWARDVDLHQGKVVEASLFDPGSEETLHETRGPRVNADDDSPEHTFVTARRQARTHGPALVAKGGGHPRRKRARKRATVSGPSLARR